MNSRWIADLPRLPGGIQQLPDKVESTSKKSENTIFFHVTTIHSVLATVLVEITLPSTLPNLTISFLAVPLSGTYHACRR